MFARSGMRVIGRKKLKEAAAQGASAVGSTFRPKSLSDTETRRRTPSISFRSSFSINICVH